MSAGNIILGLAFVGAVAYGVDSMLEGPESCHLNADGMVEVMMKSGKIVEGKAWEVAENNKTCYADTNPPLFVPVR